MPVYFKHSHTMHSHVVHAFPLWAPDEIQAILPDDVSGGELVANN